MVAGIDEAGRGPLAGPVVAAAVIFDLSRRPPKGINDSKKLTPVIREELYEAITAKARYGIGIATVAEIDTHNILGATMIAMARAVSLLGIIPDVALVDGNRAPALPCRVKTVVEGDALSISIAAASIIAKVTRDRMMRELAREFPGYGWETNVGYGTDEHYRGLNALGVTPHHRRSFAPVRALVEPDLFERADVTAA